MPHDKVREDRRLEVGGRKNRDRFKLKNEKAGKKKQEHVIGQAQKEEVKGITGTWLSYFNEKQINGILFNAVKSLLHLLELPENPYIYLSNQLRISELFYGVSHEKDVKYELQEVSNPDAVTNVCQIENNSCIWGLEPILRAIDPEPLTKLLKRINAYEVVLTGVETSQGVYNIRAVNALTGPPVFHGILLPYIPACLSVSQDCVITGPKFEKGIAMFANQIINEVLSIENSVGSLVVGVAVEKSSYNNAKKKRKAEEEFKMWTLSKIKSSRSSFVSAIKAATVSSRKIVFEFYVDLPPVEDLDEDDEEELEDAGMRRRLAIPGNIVFFKKQYSMHFRQTDKDKNPCAPIKSFAQFPFSSLCLGVFQTRSDAHFYAELFQTEEGDCWTMEMRDNYSAYRSFLKGQLIKHYISGDLIHSVEYLTCLVAMASRYTVVDDIKRLMRSSAGKLHGLVGWNHVMRTVLEMLHSRAGDDGNSNHHHHRGFSNHDMVDRIVQQFRIYRDELVSVVLGTDSSEVVSMRRAIRHALYDVSDHVSKRLIVDDTQTVKHLEHVNFMCEALEMTVGRDIIAVLTNPYFHKGDASGDTIVNLIEEVIGQVLQSGPLPEEETGGKKKKKGEKVPAKKETSAEDMTLSFFAEVSRASLEAFQNEARATERARADVRVISVPNAVKVAKKKRNVPSEIVREATLLEYITDTRLDKVLHGIVKELFTNGKLYPNPFPLIVVRLRAEVLRHMIWTERDTDLRQKLAHGRSRVKLISARNYLYKTVKGDVYGSHSALRACDGPSAASIMSILDSAGVVSPTLGPNERHAGPGEDNSGTKRLGAALDISVCTSIGGTTMLYSRLHNRSSSELELLKEQPSVTLFETHVYEGPRPQVALEIFADFVISFTLHVNDKTPNNLVLGLATGIHGMTMMNEDSGFDGGWYPVHHHERHVTPSNSAVAHDQVYFKNLRKKMYHPRYSHGEYLHIQKIRRDKALCKQEIMRATKAKEPISVIMAVLVESGQDRDPFYTIIRKHIGLYFVQTPSGAVSCYLPEFCRYEPIYQSVWCDVDQAMTCLHTISPLAQDHLGGHHHLQDPADAENPAHRSYVESLKLRIAHNYSKGDVLVAYRAMLRLAMLDQHQHVMPDLVRMLKSSTLSLQLDLLIDRSDLIQALLQERLRSEESKRKIKAKVLKQHYEDYRRSVEDALARQDCVFFPGIRNAIHVLLLRTGDAIEADRIGNVSEHFEFLQELHTYLECIRISAAGAIHNNCDHIDQIFLSFAKELLPVSELSFIS